MIAPYSLLSVAPHFFLRGLDAAGLKNTMKLAYSTLHTENCKIDILFS